MAQTQLDYLKKVDPADLLKIIQKDQQSPDYQILEWSARPLTSKGQANPDGLHLVEGRGYDHRGETDWRVVVKSTPTVTDPGPPGNLWYWKRELELFRSGMIDQIPGAIATPHCYLAEETPWGIRIWMEYVHDESPERWPYDLFTYAALETGRWNGCCFQNKFLPVDDWLCRDHRRDWLVLAERSTTWKDRSSPYLRKVLSEEDQERAVRILEEKENWLALIHRLPKVFSHFDLQRRNFLIRKSKADQDELLILDWANTGIGPLGAELCNLVGANALIFEVDPGKLAELDELVFDAYIQGMREAGWSGNPEIVRLGYTAWFALFAGALGPAMISLLDSENWQKWGWRSFSCGPDDLTEGWADLCRYALDRADETRNLIDRLQI